MKRFILLLLVISFVGMAIFGSMLFDMGPGHTGGCIASAVDGAVCPTNATDFAIHHLSALETFTKTITPTLSDSFLSLILLFLVAISISLFFKDSLFPKLKFLLQRFRNLELASSYSRQKFISWLSLFELSPALH